MLPGRTRRRLLPCHQQRPHPGQPAGLAGVPALPAGGGFPLGQVRPGLRGHGAVHLPAGVRLSLLGAGHPRERRSLHLGGGHGVGRRRLCGQYHPVRADSLSGTDLRSALSLRSACFALSWQEDHFAVTTRGYGHGVGLSQEGARAMAAGGSSWQDILLYYFPGTQIGQES